jgi:hypothetical protein
MAALFKEKLQELQVTIRVIAFQKSARSLTR